MIEETLQDHPGYSLVIDNGSVTVTYPAETDPSTGEVVVPGGTWCCLEESLPFVLLCEVKKIQDLQYEVWRLQNKYESDSEG